MLGIFVLGPQIHHLVAQHPGRLLPKALSPSSRFSNALMPPQVPFATPGRNTKGATRAIARIEPGRFDRG